MGVGACDSNSDHIFLLSFYLFIFFFEHLKLFSLFTRTNLHLNLILFETFLVLIPQRKFSDEFYFTLIFFFLNSQFFRHGRAFLSPLVESIKNTLSNESVLSNPINLLSALIARFQRFFTRFNYINLLQFHKNFSLFF